ncbi:hypothetical protein HDU91_006388 [Kappamyces sp. JEL0680]|nr:hypothetical protein HDU91_006388 [Kappamyces sp. JEL0680]
MQKHGATHSKRTPVQMAVMVVAALILLAGHFRGKTTAVSYSCDQVAPWEGDGNSTLDDRYRSHLASHEYIEALIGRFSGAIQVPTVSFDGMRGGPKGSEDQDPALHQPFLDFHSYLKRTYPLVHKHLTRHVVNQYSLLFVWQGTDAALKPGMLMAHQDVVPVDPNTAGQWKFPPFSGARDEDKIYGRGTVDTKMTLVSILEAAEALLETGYVPTRTFFFSFGHDEEISGFNGIRKIVSFIQSKYKIATNGIEFILDEGMSLVDIPAQKMALQEPRPTGLALVGVSEKGYMDLNITITMKRGGHASLPPSHTAIGILSQMIKRLEDDPFPMLLKEDNPILGQMQCLAQHSDSLTRWQKFALDHFPVSAELIYRWFGTVPMLRAAISTTQAADVISGGVKVGFFV